MHPIYLTLAKAEALVLALLAGYEYFKTLKTPQRLDKLLADPDMGTAIFEACDSAGLKVWNPEPGTFLVFDKGFHEFHAYRHLVNLSTVLDLARRGRGLKSYGPNYPANESPGGSTRVGTPDDEWENVKTTRRLIEALTAEGKSTAAAKRLLDSYLKRHQEAMANDKAAKAFAKASAELAA